MCKENQIKEMADVECYRCPWNDGECKWNNCSGWREAAYHAEKFYNAGYRKQSDIAKAVLEDIRAAAYYPSGKDGDTIVIYPDTLTKIEKKYAEPQMTEEERAKRIKNAKAAAERCKQNAHLFKDQYKSIPKRENAKRNFLVITEKPLLANIIKQAFEELGEACDFNIDIELKNNHIINIDDIGHTYRISVDLIDYKRYKPKSKDIDGVFIIHEFSPEYSGARIKELIAANQYSAIINACEHDTEGNLTFLYTLESLGLEEYPSVSLEAELMVDIESIKRGLLKLNDTCVPPSTI